MELDEVLADFTHSQPISDVHQALSTGQINVIEVLDNSLGKYLNRHSGGEPNKLEKHGSQNENL
jgi:hypothetical protein